MRRFAFLLIFTLLLGLILSSGLLFAKASFFDDELFLDTSHLPLEEDLKSDHNR